MAIQIINCPECGTFLLDDTAECHACGHILNANRAGVTKRRSLPTDHAVDQDMEVCTTCGESVRTGLVRCWNCGSFTRPEIERAYRERVESTGEGFDRSFDLPELNATSVTEEDSLTRRASTPENLLDSLPMAREENDGADDFELSEDVHMSDIDEDAFELGQQIQLRTGDADAPVYSMEPMESSSVPLSMAADHEMETIPLMSTAAEPDTASEVPSLSETIPPLGEAGPPSTEKPAAAEKAPLTPEDELLKIAADEEKEISQVRKGMRTKDSFVVFCPQGHRIRVREKFRGKTGKCPRCESVFIVPQKSSPKPKKKTDVEISTVGGEAAPAGVIGRYSRWLNDIHLHTVVPEKLKIKADSLLNDFTSVDIGFSANEILVVTLVASGGLFGGAAKKKPAIRAAMLEYFTNPDALVEGLTAATKRVIPREAFGQLALAQPVPAGTESLFGNIPIFGTGRIAVRLPRLPEDKGNPYLSFSLSEFRAFAMALQSVCGIEAFGSNSEVPISEQYESFKCHYSENPVRSLQQLEYYQKDTNIKLEVSGWKCSMCGLIVSEEARKKEKIGGLNGKGIAKAKCPKCTQKFGSNPMYAIADTAPPPTVAATAADEAPAEPSAEQPAPEAST